MSGTPQLDPRSLFYRDDDIHLINEDLKKNLGNYLVVDYVRELIASTRYHYFRQTIGAINIKEGYDSESVAQFTVEHNLRGLADLSAARSHLLLRPLMSINEVHHARFGGEMFLSIGPRSEGEILNLIGYGVPPDQITALDLISCSPLIDVGDIHEAPYPDNSFSVVILGFVLGYSKNPRKLVSEIIRISKNGAIIAIGNEYNPKSNEELRVEANYEVWEVSRYTTTKEIIGLFEGHVEKVCFETEPAPEWRDHVGALLTIIKIKK